MRFSTFFLFLLTLSFSIQVGAQADLPSPNEFLEGRYGSAFTPHHKLVDYFYAIARLSDKVIVKEYGKTEQNRPLIMAYVSSSNNLEELEDLREAHLAGLDSKSSDAEDKAIVWLSYGVHGNEAGASESAMASLYALISGKEAGSDQWLENTIVLLDPCLNPDGYSRYTHWQANVSNKSIAPEFIAKEHHEPWPGGRVNHYLFDLNRDWAWQTQVETKARIALYQKWMPHIHADFHEMWYDQSYYFAPAAAPFHKYITPWQGSFQTTVGKNHARYFDKEGWLYYTKEYFDLFYPSFGDTYPIFNGSIGMTYEQAGHSLAGRAIFTPNDDTLKLEDRIIHHKTVALSTVEIASKNADPLIENMQKYYENNRKNPVGDYKTYIVKQGTDASAFSEFIALLDRNGIEYGFATKTMTTNALEYKTNKKINAKVNQGDMLISAFQDQSTLLQVLMEPLSELSDSLTYDITSWALPYAYGLDAYATTQKIAISKQESATEESQITTADAYAYCIPPEGLASQRLVAALLQKGLRIRQSAKMFRIAGQDFQSGTCLVTRADNRKIPNWTELVKTLAQQHPAKIYDISTGFVEKGPDFGSDQMKLIVPPKIILVSGSKTQAGSFGESWYYFENILAYPVTCVDTDQLKNVDWTKYNTLVLPEGNYGSIDLNQLSEWIQAGGKLIAIGSAVGTFAGKGGYTLQRAKAIKGMASNVLDSSGVITYQYEDRERTSLSQSISGAVIPMNIDLTHPLAFGMNAPYFALKTSSKVYPYLEKGWNVAYTSDEAEVIGFAGSELIPKLEKTMSVGIEHKGKGKVIYFVDNPLFRAFWYKGQVFFGNAILMP